SHGFADRVGSRRCFFGLLRRRAACCLLGFGCLLLGKAFGLHPTLADFPRVVERTATFGKRRDHRLGGFGFLCLRSRCVSLGCRAGFAVLGFLGLSFSGRRVRTLLNLGFGGRVSGRLGHFELAGRRCHCLLRRLRRRFADAGCLRCGQGFLLLLTEGFHGTLDGLLHVCGGLGQALLDRLLDVFNLGCRLDSVCIFSGGRCRSSGGGCLHGGLVDHLRRTVTFACCDRFRCSHGVGRRQNRLIAGVLLAGLLTGIFRLCGTAAAMVIAAALAVARTAFGTVLSGVRIVVGLLLGLVDQQLLVLRCGLLPAGLSALFLAAFLGAGALLLGVLRRGGAGSAAATTTAAGAAAF